MKKYLLTVISLLLFALPLFSQNPIIKEEIYRIDNNGQWRKDFIVERAYENGILTNLKRRSFDFSLNDWVLQSEIQYNRFEAITKRFNQYYQGKALGFFKDLAIFEYAEDGFLLKQEVFFKLNKDSPLRLNTRIEQERLGDCSYLQKRYESVEENSETLSFTNLQVRIYDKNCEFAGTANSNRPDANVEDLSKQIRVTFKQLTNGDQRRIVERLVCPNTFGCDDWEILEQKTFDKSGKLLIEERGATTSSVRRITYYDYEATQITTSTETFRRTQNLTTQTLFSRDVEIKDTNGNILARKRFEPLSFDEWSYHYNEKGLIEGEYLTRTWKDSTGLHTYQDTTLYNYQYYCDDLPAEQIRSSRNYRSRTIYSYLQPSNCGGATKEETFAFELFPNPAKNLLTISSEQFIETTVDLKIVDVYGRVVHQQANYRSTDQTIDIEDLPVGLYYLGINTGEKWVSKPFIVQR